MTLMKKNNPYALRNWLLNEKDNIDIQINLLNSRIGKYNKKRADIILRLKFLNQKIKEIEERKR